MTIDSDRGSIDALLAKYTYDYDTRDLYVEGETDKSIYDRYLRESGRRDVTVFDIGSIDVPQEVVSSFGLRGGNRDRVTALSLILDDEFPTGLPHVRCVVDSDFDFILPTRSTPRHLLHTDYTSVELYAYGKGPIGEILMRRCDMDESEIQPTYDSMTKVLSELFLIRATNQLLSWDMRSVSFTNCCDVSGTLVVFNREEFVLRYLNANSKYNMRAEFDSAYNQLSLVNLNDARQGIRGRDYTALLGWYLHEKCGWQGDRSNSTTVILAALRQLLWPLGVRCNCRL